MEGYELVVPVQIHLAVTIDLDDGIDYGVMGTPAFFINGRLIDGVVPFSVFERIIDEELAKADSR